MPRPKMLRRNHSPDSWVMLSQSEGFTSLPGEQRLYNSPPRTTLSISSHNTAPGREKYSLYCSSGCVHVTNRRIVYLPTQPTSAFRSFAAPILNIHDTHVAAPFFGPNVWSAIVQPVPGGGLPAAHLALELKLTFKDGGAFDFHSTFERIKERLQQAVEVARESGTVAGDGVEEGGAAGAGALGALDWGNVHLDQLPAYEQSGASRAAPPPVTSGGQRDRDSGLGESPEANGAAEPPDGEPRDVPADPPPGYEEVQRGSVAEELERRLRVA
ncbi:hypothetical protein P152DRAFT_482363 [Eremomyces bilateralis CBS 781.70]|uniref:WW-domain-binding protein n=1 Tax=Eremomyces bilateralis CBS 781.70 TaxID=1392243 RepID=A0A6G1G2U9_9PEZI|nr:uncharacterized protein P152DRAFT_482363 [Eremomyces bilateralis CBS 781.70]KAF1812338.1 hypothetical protein P152DRAFT_482363 [Eremomyces bilateralis CBS 781.70]